MLAVARPSVPTRNITAMPRAGEPGMISVASGIAQTMANSNAEIATISIGRPIHRCEWNVASTSAAGIITPAPRPAARSLPHRSLKRAAESEASSSPNPSPKATIETPVLLMPKWSFNQLPNVMKTV